MKIINLGSGNDYRIGFINWDISKRVKADAYLDFRKDRFPAEDCEIDEIFCGNVLEQILENEQLIHCLNECWRVLNETGTLTLRVPNSLYSITYLDPNDCRHFIPKTFDYFDYNKIQYQRFGKVYGYKPWEVLSITENTSHILEVRMKKHAES